MQLWESHVNNYVMSMMGGGRPVSMFDKEVYFMWGEGNYRATSERAKTSVYVGKGLPAASRLDRLMNFFTELFVAA